MLYRLCLPSSSSSYPEHNASQRTSKSSHPDPITFQSEDASNVFTNCFNIQGIFLFLIWIIQLDTDDILIPGTVKNRTMYLSYFRHSLKMTMQLNPQCSFWTQSWTRHLSTNFIWSFFNMCVQEENINFDTSFLVVYSQRKCVNLCDLWTI